MTHANVGNTLNQFIDIEITTLPMDIILCEVKKKLLYLIQMSMTVSICDHMVQQAILAMAKNIDNALGHRQSAVLTVETLLYTLSFIKIW